MKLKVIYAYGHTKTPKISWNIRFSWPHLRVQEPAHHIHTGRYFWDNLIHLNIDSTIFWSVPQTESGLKWEVKEKKNYFLSQYSILSHGWMDQESKLRGQRGTPGLRIALCSKIRSPSDSPSSTPQDRHSPFLPILLTHSDGISCLYPALSSFKGRTIRRTPMF